MSHKVNGNDPGTNTYVARDEIIPYEGGGSPLLVKGMSPH